MRIGLMRVMPEPWNLESNMSTLEKSMQEAASKGVELLMTCECFLDGYCVSKTGVRGRMEGELRLRFESMVQDKNSAYLSRVSQLCREYGMGLILGVSTLEEGKIYNTAIFYGTDGEEIGRYHKTHLYSHDLNYVPGEAFRVFETRWGRLGILICADRRWPEAARTLRVRGAQMILLPTYGMRHEANTMWMRTRAYENECWLAFCHPDVGYICDANGDIAAWLESNVPGILVHDIDLSVGANEKMFDLRGRDIYEI